MFYIRYYANVYDQKHWSSNGKYIFEECIIDEYDEFVRMWKLRSFKIIDRIIIEFQSRNNVSVTFYKNIT